LSVDDYLEPPIMKEKTFTDTALGIAPVALFVAWVGTLYWVGGWGPWVRSAHILFFFIAIYGIGAVVQARADGRLDEVELAAARFGARWGLVSGVAFVTLLTFLPPIHALLAEVAEAFGRIEDKTMTRESRLFLLGIATTFVAQETFRSVFTAAWRWSKR
jgi:hypothetical protein